MLFQKEKKATGKFLNLKVSFFRNKTTGQISSTYPSKLKRELERLGINEIPRGMKLDVKIPRTKLYKLKNGVY